MSVNVIPVTNSQGFYTMNVVLNGAVYGLNFRWNLRMARWVMDVLDSTGTLLLAGLPVLEEQGLTNRFVQRVAGLPPGSFVAIDGNGTRLDPSDTTFGTDVQLLYQEA